MSPSARAKSVLAVAAAAMLAGCSGAVIGHDYHDYGYGPGEWSGNDMPMLVRGTPFAAPQAEIDQAVADAMQGTTFGVPTRFVPAAPGASPAYRVVMVFGPPPGLDGYALCAVRPEPPNALFGAPPAARVELLAAFCRGDRTITSADGTVPTGSGPGGAEFRQAIAQFAYTLFPGHMFDKPGNDKPTHT
ncbi:MAG TPA: hypothetical protein VFA50_02135 [Stellaceae bacterium]|nr:hypothetical protein [Stellaceae bacterium]